MELRHLRYFCAVADQQGFSRAARALHVSQSAISEQIADLEDEIGVPLLTRQQHKVGLTPHGRIFLTEARNVLENAQQAVTMAQRSLRGEVGELTIAFFTGGMGTALPRLIRNFRQKHPEVRVSLLEMTSTMQSRALLEGTIDVAFTRPLEPHLDREMCSETLRLDPLFAVLPKDHPLASGPVDIRSLSSERFILCGRDTSSVLHDKIFSLCTEAGIAPEIASVSPVWSTITTLVQAGEGIAILPINMQQFATNDLVFCPLTNAHAVIELVMAWSPLRETGILCSFLNLVRASRERGAV
jgi:DNA-binding transcriptional LysR family regulator